MSKADFYRRKHLKLMDKPKQEESLLMSCLFLGLVVAGVMFWVGFFILMVPEM